MFADYMPKLIILYLLFYCFTSINTGFTQISDLNKSSGPFFRSAEKMGLKNDQDEILIPAAFDTLIPFSDELLIAALFNETSQTTFYGLLDKTGTEKISFQYRNLMAADNFLIAASRIDDDVKYGIIDTKGSEILDFDYFQIESLGLNFFLLTDYSGHKQVVDITNKAKIILNRLDSATHFTHDVSVVYYNGKCGLMSAIGEMILPISYKSIAFIDDETIEITPLAQWDAYDFSSQKLFGVQADSAYLFNNDTIGLSFRSYSFLKPIESDSSKGPFPGSMIKSLGNSMVVSLEGQFYLVNMMDQSQKELLGTPVMVNEHYLITRQKGFERDSFLILANNGKRTKAEDFRIEANYVYLRHNGFWGVYDKKFELVIRPLYNEIHRMANSDFMVNYQGNFGIINNKEEWVHSPTYKKMEEVDTGIYWGLTHFLQEYLIEGTSKKEADLHYLMQDNFILETNIEGEVRIVSKQGMAISTYIKATYYDHLSDSVLLNNGKNFIYLTADGNSIFSIKGYDAVSLQNDNFLPIYKDNGYGFIDLKGKLRIANRYKQVKPFSEDMAAIQIGNKWGFIDRNEALLIQPYYDFAQPFKNGLAIIAIAGKHGLINKNGQEVIQLKYDSIQRIDNFYLLRKGTKWGVADLTGKFRFYPNYDEINIRGDFLVLKRYNQYKIANKSGQFIFDDSFDAVIFNKSPAYFLLRKNGKKLLVSLTELLNAKQ